MRFVWISAGVYALAACSGATGGETSTSSSGSTSSGAAGSSSSTSSSSASSSSSGSITSHVRWGEDLYAHFAEALGGSGEDHGIALTVGRAYQVYVAGTFSDTMTLDGITLQATRPHDIFLAAFRSDGQLLWLKQPFRGSVELSARSLRPIFSDDGVAVAGTFSGTLDLEGTELVSVGQRDIFVTHFSDAGTMSFARRIGGAGDDVARTFTHDGILAGSFTGEMDVATGVITSVGQRDAFVLRIDEQGLIQSPQGFGGPGDDEALEATTISTGELLIAGSFQDTLTVDGHTLTSEGGTDIFLVLQTGGGSRSWAVRVGGVGEDVPLQLALPIEGNRMALLMEGTHDLAPGGAAAGQHILTFDDTGALTWALQPPAPVSVIGVTLILRVLMLGSFDAPFTYGQTTLTPVGGTDVHILSTDYNGEPGTARSVGGPGDESATSLSITGLGVVYFTGSLEDTVSVPEGRGAASNGGPDALIVRIRE
ncbi:MAG: hypothetical protein AB2A00_37865 [Myxococcota bacterium]